MHFLKSHCILFPLGEVKVFWPFISPLCKCFKRMKERLFLITFSGNAMHCILFPRTPREELSSTPPLNISLLFRFGCSSFLHCVCTVIHTSFLLGPREKAFFTQLGVPTKEMDEPRIWKAYLIHHKA